MYVPIYICAYKEIVKLIVLRGAGNISFFKIHPPRTGKFELVPTRLRKWLRNLRSRVLSPLQTLAGAPQRTPDNRAPKRAALPKRRRKSALKSEATPKRQIARKRAPGAPPPRPPGKGSPLRGTLRSPRETAQGCAPKGVPQKGGETLPRGVPQKVCPKIFV